MLASTSFANLRGEADFVASLGRACGAKTCRFGFAADWFAADVPRSGNVDYVVSGEVEAVARPLVRGQRPSDTPGLWFRDGDRIEHTGRVLVEDLSSLPYPDWGVTPLRRYHYYPLLPKDPFATLLSSRGCPYGCDYCPYYVVQGSRFRFLGAESVVDEIERGVERYGIRSYLFRDPCFGHDRRRVIDICRGLVDRRCRVDWGCETRLDGLDAEVAVWLGRANCRFVIVGLDSVSAQTTKENNRRTLSPESVRERIQALRGQGVAAAGLFAIGLPADTEGSVRATIAFANSLPLTYVNYQIPIAFPGTRMYDALVARGVCPRATFASLTGSEPRLSTGAELSAIALRAPQARGARSFYLRGDRIREIARRVDVRSTWSMVARTVNRAAPESRKRHPG